MEFVAAGSRRPGGTVARLAAVAAGLLVMSQQSLAQTAGRDDDAPLVMAQGLRDPSRSPQWPGGPDRNGALPGPAYGYPPYGAYGPPPQQQAAPPPCPDVGSTAVVERRRPRATGSGPLVAMPTNDCADLPGRATVQPYIGVDVQVSPAMPEQDGPPPRPRPGHPKGRGPGG